MSAEPKLTPWFVNGEKPARPGVYNVSCRKENQSGHWYARWDGEQWFRARLSVDGAAGRALPETLLNYWSDIGSWRGLAEKPE